MAIEPGRGAQDLLDGATLGSPGGEHSVARSAPRRQVGERRRLHGLRHDPQLGVAEHLARESPEGRWPKTDRREVCDEAVVRPGEGAHPEISQDFLSQRPLVREQLGIERHGALERLFLQYALAEAVDGRDRRLIEPLQRQPEPRSIRGGVWAAACEQVAQVCVDTSRDRRVLAAEQRRRDPRADAITELRRGRVRVSHHQDLLHAELALEQKTHEQRGDRVRFARARARFDEMRAAKLCVEQAHSFGSR